MFVSYRWLMRHVDLAGVSPEEAARALTLHTAEVEHVAPFARSLGAVVCGHVLERQQHPNADRLSLCRVDIGDESLQIVCGASNVAAGQRVAVARVGTELDGGLRIKKSTIRGVESEGMICSERELGLGDEHEGIWVLPEEVPLGRSVAAVLGGHAGALDWVLSIDNKSLTHRPDLWGHRGLARELAAILGRKLLPLELDLPACGYGPQFPVRIETRNCWRYIALPIDGARVERSPDWLRHLLLAAGQRPIDLLVDLSNFVMLDLGQPNHLFDRDALSKQGIWIRDARPGERLATLDGVERRLEASDMLIGSGDHPVALAGVMGGEGSKVEAGTSRLLLEVASFHPTVVRRTAARLSLRTEASSRFEKHLDPNLPLQAAAHLVRLLQAIQPFISLPSPPTDAGEWKDPSRTISLRCNRLNSLLGLDMKPDQVSAALRRLDFGVRARGGDALDVDVPSFRATKDITIEEDLIEEVGRLVGYAAIPERELLARLRPTPRDARAALARSLADELAGFARFHEVLSYSFVPADLAEKLGIAGEPHVEVINPVLEGWQRVRRSVVPGLIGHLVENLRRAEVVELFEIGKGYLPEHTDERGEPREVHEVGLVRAAPRSRSGRFDQGSFAMLRGILEVLLQRRAGEELIWKRAKQSPESSPGWAHPGRSSVVFSPSNLERPLAFIAAIEPGVLRNLSLAADAAAAWISLDALLSLDRRQARFRPIPRFPSVKVDVALALPAEVDHARAVAAIGQAGKGLVTQVELFDVYTGSSVGSAMRSLAYHVVLEAPDRTLSEADCRKFLDRVERAAAELGGQLRREAAREASPGGQASPSRVG